MDTLFDSLKLGHLLDGLICIYGVFKRSINRKAKIHQIGIIPLKNTLTEIYQLLPAHLQQDYKKKRCIMHFLRVKSILKKAYWI